MKTHLQVAIIAFIGFLLLLVSLSKQTTLADVVNVCATVPETYGTTSLDPSTGGTFLLDTADADSVNLSYPIGFYSLIITLEASSYSPGSTCSSEPAPSGENFVGKMYIFNLYDASGNSVSAINNAATIVAQYSSSDINGLNEDDIAPYWWDTNTSSWQLIGGGAIDTVNHQVIFSTTLSGLFALFAPASQPPPPPPPPSSPPQSGGGGGGGGEFVAPVAPSQSGGTIIISGRAYPLSKVVILEDGQVITNTIADPDANFNVSISDLSTGNYIFSLYGQDSSGNRSNVFTFPTYVATGTTVEIGSIFISPTISVNKTEVKQGDPIEIFGQSTPSSTIGIQVHSANGLFFKTQSDSNGIYLYNLDTSALNMGQHLTEAEAIIGDNISSLSDEVSFQVGNENVLQSMSGCPPNYSIADLNHDCRVNLIDFSIMAYWYGKPNPPVSVLLDYTKKVDLADFSILAYYWTG